MIVQNFCPSCGSPHGIDDLFCDRCGFRLNSAEVPSSGFETRSLVEEITYQAGTYLENKTRAFSLNPGFDDAFSSCMQTKGYKVPLGILPKLHELMPYFGEKLEHMDEGAIVKRLLASMGGEFSLVPVELALLGQEIYDRAEFEHALVDCFLRAQPGGLGPVTTAILDAFPVPDAPPPLPEVPPAPPVLPAPPPNWQPMVIPPPPPTPPPKPAGSGPGKVIGGLAAAGVLGIGVFAGLQLVDHPVLNPDINPVSAHVIAIDSVGDIKCQSTVHGGYVTELNCSTIVALSVSGDVPSQGVTVLMDYVYGPMHGSASVPQGTRGPLNVQLHVQSIYSGCTADPNYTTTVDVYDGMIVNSGPLLASRNFTFNHSC